MAGVRQRAATSTVSVLEDTSWDRVWAAQVRKLLDLAWPWSGLVVLWLVAALFHHLWGGLWPTAAGVFFCALVLSGLLFVITRQRGPVGQIHAAATPVCVGGWLTAAMLAGPAQRWVLYCWLVFGGTMCLAWNARTIVRSRVWDDIGAGGDVLTRLFAERREAAGFKGAILRVLGGEAGPGEPKKKLPVRLTLAPGATQDEAIKKVPNFESAHHLPPGAAHFAPNLDRADQIDGVITDPRKIRKFTVWPGPSYEGGSIAEPLRLGIWQDGEDVFWKWLKVHLQVMGMTGAGKSTMAGWTILGEIISRIDVAVFAADITKGDQTLGPLRPALHAVAKTKPQARALLDWLHGQIRVRTDDLAAQGLQSWRPGAKNRDGTPMLLWFAHLEEFPDIFECLTDKQQERWLSAVKAARSAGILWLISLQRSDYSQMPTIARGQLANICLGVQDSADATFGLSELQQNRKASPELWQAHYPGMAYFDAVGLDDKRRAMPLRFFSWGEDDKLIAAHAAKYPASERPLPAAAQASLEAAMRAAGKQEAAVIPDDPDEDGGEREEAAQIAAEAAGPDDDEEARDMRVNPDQPITVDAGFGGHQFAGAVERPEVDAKRALEMVEEQIGEWARAGRSGFSATELLSVAEQTGRKRSWLYYALGKVAEKGLIERTDEGVSTWAIHASTHPLTETEGRGGGV